MKKTIEIKKYMDPSLEGTYFPIPFPVGPGVEQIDIDYRYDRFRSETRDGEVTRSQVNIVDLSLCGPEGLYIGSSGSDRSHIRVSATGSSQGYARVPAKEGEWAIIAGAYKIAPEGVEVTYTVTFTMKQRRLFKGDTHVHTLGSDGFLPAEETARLAAGMGLDYLFITDHNNYAHNEGRHEIEGLTILPGMEWTHYRGHAGMLGVKKPFEGAFYTNTGEETAAKLREARDNGAFIVLNHPFCPDCPWKWGFDNSDYDGVEIWNGVMSERNLRAVAWWHQQLRSGRKLPVTGGSDFHRPGLFSSLAMPCMCLYAPSRDPEDLLAAIRKGSGYISYLPGGPGMDADCGGKSLGDTVALGDPMELTFFNLRAGDVLRILGDDWEESVTCGPDVTELCLRRVFCRGSFVRFEIHRCYEQGLPSMPAMISNPIYFSR